MHLAFKGRLLPNLLDLPLPSTAVQAPFLLIMAASVVQLTWAPPQRFIIHISHTHCIQIYRLHCIRSHTDAYTYTEGMVVCEWPGNCTVAVVCLVCLVSELIRTGVNTGL